MKNIRSLALFTFFLITSAVAHAQITADGLMKISSTDFAEGGNIPQRFTCEGQNISPALQITGVPDATKSLVLILDDPDAPAGTFTHWLIWNISPDVKDIPLNSAPQNAVQGTNDAKKTAYTGPCPPSGVHRYYFRLYAIDIAALKLPATASRKDLDKAIEGHVLKHATLIGKYAKGEGAR